MLFFPVENLDPGGPPRLNGEALKKPLAKGMNRLDLEAAWRLDCPRKELAGAVALIGGRRLPQQNGQPVPEFALSRRRPKRKLGKYALRHLGGGRLGVSEAEDALRRG